jgi:hypothetical protein
MPVRIAHGNKTTQIAVVCIQTYISNTMRILFVVPDLRGANGWSNYASALGQAYQAMGHEVAALTSKKSDSV